MLDVTSLACRFICRAVALCYFVQLFYPAHYVLPGSDAPSLPRIEINKSIFNADLLLNLIGIAPAHAQDPLLSATPDADSEDPFIVEKAAELGNDPAQIFAFVRDEIGYESYKGSLRGARGTLWSKAGNALDQASLMIALLRASGIPAQYAQGTLSEPLAQELILSMFPEPLRVTGCLDPGVQFPDPANDPLLLAETKEHYWVQFDSGSGFQNADPAFASASIGQIFTAVVDIFTEVPNNLRHKVALRLKRELAQPLSGLFGASPLGLATVLEETFNTSFMAGKPLTIGHFVNSVPLGTPVFSSVTNTYSPYIAVGDLVANPDQDELLRGEDFQEVLTNFPFGSQVLTGVFLEVEVSGLDGPPEIFEHTLLDRIGFDVRQNGGSPNLGIDPAGAPAITDLDILTLNVLPGLYDKTAPTVLAEQFAESQQALQIQQQADGSFPPEAGATLSRFLTIITRFHSVNFFTISDLYTEQIAESTLVKAYFDRPRLIFVSNRVVHDLDTQTADLTFAMDLRRDKIRALAYPQQNETAVRVFNFTRGVFESAIERDTLLQGLPEGEPSPKITNVVNVFESASAQNIDPIFLAQEDITILDTLDISGEAKARIAAAINQGKVIVAPSRSVLLNNRVTTAWYEVNPDTGETIGVMEDGSHGIIAEYTGIIAIEALIIGFVIGFSGVGYFFSSIPQCHNPDGTVNKGCLLGGGFLDIIGGIAGGAGLGTVAQGAAAAGTSATLAPVLIIGALFLAGVIVGGIALIALASDPPLGDFLFAPEPLDAFANLNGADIAADIVHDPLFTLPFGGAQLPTVFRLGIKNSNAQADTFTLNFNSVAPGFEAQTSVPEIHIPPGETAEVGICLRPTGAISAPGTNAAFIVKITSTNNPAVSIIENEPFTIPEIRSIALSATPSGLSSTPGTPVTTELIINVLGNVPLNVAFAIDASQGLGTSALNPVSLGMGETVQRSLTLTPAPDTLLNSTLTAVVSAEFGAPLPVGIAVPLQIAVPGADAISQASIAAAELGDLDLANRLDDLSIALTDLVQNPADPIFLSQALANLDSLISQLSNDPVLSFFVPDLLAAKNALQNAAGEAEILSAVSDLGAALETFADIAGALAESDFEIFLLPNNQVAQPLTPAVFEVRLHNIGTQTTTYNLSLLSALPAGVTALFSQTSVTLDADEFSAGITLTLTPTSATELVPFTFEVGAEVLGLPEINHSAQGSLSVRNELISVVSVAAEPPFADPGTSVDISARLLNGVNQEQEVKVFYTLHDSAGVPVGAPSAPVQTTLSVLTTLDTIDLGSLDTTALALDNYAIEVTVTDLFDQPIPGATGQGALLIGSPVTASLALDTDTLPQGDGMVMNTLQIDAQTGFTDPFTLLGQTTISGTATDLALRGDYAYVCSNSGITIVNVSDPENPAFVKIIAPGAVRCAIDGDLLATVAAGPPFTIRLYSLTADPETPALLGSTTVPYHFPVDLLLNNTHAYVAQLLICFFIASNDVFSQHGDLLSIDISNTALPALDDVLFNTHGTSFDGNETPGCGENGGSFNMFSTAQTDANTLLLTSTTATGTDTQTGIGRIRVADISDPSNLAVIDANELQIPGTTQTVGIAVQGNRALVSASTGGWNDMDPVSIGFTGSIVLAVLDVSDTDAPQLLSTRTLSRASIGVGRVSAVNNNRYVFSSLGFFNNDPHLLYLVDASDPDNLVIGQTGVPENVQRTSVIGNIVYTASAAGLLIYEIGDAIGIPVTAEVPIPKNTGVAVIPGAFNIEPSDIVSGADFDTLVWDMVLSEGDTGRTFSWKTSISDLQPGELREVTGDTNISFTSQGTPGEIILPPLAVSGEHILGIAPPTQTAQPGEAAAYTLTVRNPTGAQVTYALAVQGVAPAWAGLAPELTLPANSETTLPLILTSDPFAVPGDYGFSVTATGNGASGAVSAELVLAGEPVLPALSAVARGVVVQLIPAQATAGQGTDAHYTARVTNTGSLSDTFDLSLSPLAGIASAFAQNAVEVPPGAGNFRDTLLTLTPAPGTAVNAYPFTVTASSAQAAGVQDQAAGVLNVVAQGVAVSIDPPSGNPQSAFSLSVQNSGQVSDTFALSLGGPVGLTAGLGSTSVSLAPGASQTIPITLGDLGFALPGALDLIGIAVSQSNNAVQDSARAQVIIAPAKGVSALFDPESMTLPEPGAARFVLRVDNTGNTEDSYSATIVDNDNLDADLIGLDGMPAQSVPVFILPGLAQGALVLDALLPAPGEGTVTVRVQSATDENISALATARVDSGEVEVIPMLRNLALWLLLLALLGSALYGLRRRQDRTMV